MDWTIAGVAGVVGAIFGSGGLYAYFKLGPERGQITVNAAEGAVIVHSGVLKDINEQYKAIKDELSQVKMEAETAEQAHMNCRQEIGEFKVQLKFLQRDLDRHGQMTVLARRKTHLALNAIGGYEILVDNILTELRNNNVPIKDDLRSHNLRTSLQQKMDELDDLEEEVLRKTLAPESHTENAETV